MTMLTEAKTAQEPKSNAVQEKSKKQLKKERYFAKRALYFAKKREQDIKWQALCDSQRKLMKDAPQARCTKPGPKVYHAVFCKSVQTLGGDRKYFHLSKDNFEAPLRTLLEAEEAWEHTEMRRYDLENCRLRSVTDFRGRRLYQCCVPGLAGGNPSLVPTDEVILSDGSNHFRMVIEDICGDSINFKPRAKDQWPEISGKKFRLSFVPAGFNYDRYVKALRAIQDNPNHKEILFGGDPLIDRRSPAKIDHKSSCKPLLEERFQVYNSRQKQAVVNILRAECRPHLYILFGPPGTGKTFTLVETIVQIHVQAAEMRILICSGSNTCVDAIAKSIHETKQVPSMARLSSIRHYKRAKKRPDYYSIEVRQVSKCKVLVTTNVMAAKLIGKYDYVLIDEAGHSHLPESLIPITKLKGDGCVVLAGDPKQLGPVIKSHEVEKLGLGKSLLERLCELEMYGRDHEGQYNERYLTKLVESYRCDPRILNLCNHLFYHGDLKCLGKTPPSILRILGFPKPLVMAKIKGIETSPGNSTSRRNEREAKACIDMVFRLYRMGLEPAQIGVITPYLLQKETLQVEFDKRLKKDQQLLDDRFKIPRNPSHQQAEISKSKKSKKQKESEKKTKKEAEVKGQDKSEMELLIEELHMLRLDAQSIREVQDEAEKLVLNKKGAQIDWRCKIDTVDAFQGSEREIILVSTVRSPVNGKINQCGFLADAKRFNVTVSRAKWLVIVIGHPAVLDCCNLWTQYGKHSTPIKVKGI